MMKNTTLFLLALLFSFAGMVGCSKSEVTNVGGGKGGSMARFTLAGDRLYLAHKDTVRIVDVTNAVAPSYVGKVGIQSQSETIFPYKDMLFIGAPNGMEVLSISDPDHPHFLANVPHFIGCDPVVVQDDYAYVTVSANGACARGGSSALFVNDVQNPAASDMVYSEIVPEALGLGTQDSLLYLCMGDYGLQVYSIANRAMPRELYRLDTLHAWDVIPDGSRLILTGKNGLFQYDFSDPSQPVFLSQIPQ